MLMAHVQSCIICFFETEQTVKEKTKNDPDIDWNFFLI